MPNESGQPDDRKVYKAYIKPSNKTIIVLAVDPMEAMLLLTTRYGGAWEELKLEVVDDADLIWKETSDELDRLRLCLELCQKAAVGQDLGLDFADPLRKSTALSTVVELRAGLERYLEKNEDLALRIAYMSEILEVCKRLLGGEKHAQMTRPSPSHKEDKLVGILSAVRQLKKENELGYGSNREELDAGRDHLTVTGQFQSDKYPWCPVGFVPLKLTDVTAQDLLRTYAQRRQVSDSEFTCDLVEALDRLSDEVPEVAVPPVLDPDGGDA